jgi:hypothetical protein
MTTTTTWHPLQRLHLEHPRRLTARLHPLQAIAPALGAVTILAGFIAIGHSGFHAEHVYDPHDALAGVHYTPLLAACLIGFGVAMLAGAELVRLGRSRVPVLGDLALGFGTVVLTAASGAAIGFGAVVLADLWPRQLQHALNVDHTGGVLAVIVGATGLLTAITSPLAARRQPAAVEPAAPSSPPAPQTSPPAPKATPPAPPTRPTRVISTTPKLDEEKKEAS